MLKIKDNELLKMNTKLKEIVFDLNEKTVQQEALSHKRMLINNELLNENVKLRYQLEEKIKECDKLKSENIVLKEKLVLMYENLDVSYNEYTDYKEVLEEYRESE